MAAKSETVRNITETMARIANDHVNPKPLYRMVRDAHPEASKT
jgi:hypothetical protein